MTDRLDAIVVDVRFAPYSKLIHWRRPYLEALLGSAYRHVPNLGNRAFKSGNPSQIHIQNLEVGIETVLSLPRNAIIFCGCGRYEECHRKLICDELLKRGIDSTELESWTEPSH